MATTISVISQHILDQLSVHQSKYPSSSYLPPLMVAFQGPQGCGKTYLTTRLIATLNSHSLKTIIFSTDDLYLPYDDLKAVAATHPANGMLQGRGLPGTHDVNLGTHILEGLRNRCGRNAPQNEEGGAVRIPSFNKALFAGWGDRVPVEEWQSVIGPVDIVILEGWSQGFAPLPTSLLESLYMNPPASTVPLKYKSHSLQALLDINSSLNKYSTAWYPFFEVFVQVIPPDLSQIYNWYAAKISTRSEFLVTLGLTFLGLGFFASHRRLQAEHQLRASTSGGGMTDEEVYAFVDRYMPAYELFSGGIRAEGVPWLGKGLGVVIDKERKLVEIEKF